MPNAHHEPAARNQFADPLEVLKARAWAIAKLLATNLHDMSRADAVDELWRFAERIGLVERLGVDAVLRLLSEAFQEGERQ